MLKITGNYTNFNDEEVTKEVYLNINKNEAIKLETQYENVGGTEKYLKKITKAKDINAMWDYNVNLIKTAYGIKSEDGERLIKNEEVTEAFMQSAAFDALIEIMYNENATEAQVKNMMSKIMNVKL